MRKIFAVLFLLGFPAIALGHHSRAEFTDKTIEVEGVLTDLVWKNPHVALFLDVEDENGEVQNWRIEGPTNPMGLAQIGVSSDLFKIGERLRVAGDVSSSRQALLVTNALLVNGTEVIMNASTAPRWHGPHVGGSSSQPPPKVEIATDNLGFFRVWHPVGNPMMMLKRFSYTEDALAARSEWDLVDNPIVRCEAPGMPGPIFHPHPLLFTDEGENIIGLRHGYFDTYRTIHMDDTLNAEDQRPSYLGFSKGRWEDENTLVIETTRINYPYFDFNGTTQSEDIKITERYSLSDNMTRLNFEVTIDDPVALSQTANVEWHFLALDKPYSAYECNVF